MIYKLDNLTGEIKPVSSEETRRALSAYGWTAWSIDGFFRSANKVLCTRFFYFSRSLTELEILRREHSLRKSLAARGLSVSEVA
jgi:hypothetical protein